jgi:NitT/TauT family transport system substrate-binding protein
VVVVRSISKYPEDEVGAKWNKATSKRDRRGTMLVYRDVTIQLVAIAALLAASVGLAGAQSRPPDPVSIRADVFFYGAHVPIMLGIVDGVYKKYGIDATFTAGRGSGTTIQTVANMSDQFGFADGATLVRLAAQGLHAKQIVGILQTGSNSVMTLPDSNITKPQDLNGKTTGFAPGSATDQIFPAFAKKAGIDFASIKGLSVDPPTRDSLFLLKKIDFDIALAAAQLPILEERCDCKLNIMRFSDYGLSLMSNGIVASDKIIAENPDLVRRFAAATIEAINAAIASPRHGIDAFMQYAPNAGFSRKVVTEQWNVAMGLLHTPRTKDKPAGTMDEKDWQDTIDLLAEYVNLPKDTVTPSMVFTNEFLPQ